jgi:hypothetical protein
MHWKHVLCETGLQNNRTQLNHPVIRAYQKISALIVLFNRYRNKSQIQILIIHIITLNVHNIS